MMPSVLAAELSDALNSLRKTALFTNEDVQVRRIG